MCRREFETFYFLNRNQFDEVIDYLLKNEEVISEYISHGYRDESILADPASECLSAFIRLTVFVFNKPTKSWRELYPILENIFSRLYTSGLSGEELVKLKEDLLERHSPTYVAVSQKYWSQTEPLNFWRPTKQNFFSDISAILKKYDETKDGVLFIRGISAFFDGPISKAYWQGNQRKRTFLKPKELALHKFIYGVFDVWNTSQGQEAWFQDITPQYADALREFLNDVTKSDFDPQKYEPWYEKFRILWIDKRDELIKTMPRDQIPTRWIDGDFAPR